MLSFIKELYKEDDFKTKSEISNFFKEKISTRSLEPETLNKTLLEWNLYLNKLINKENINPSGVKIDKNGENPIT